MMILFVIDNDDLDALRKRDPIKMDQLYREYSDKVFTFLPSIALQRPSFSDIENVHVDYNTNKRWTF